MSDKIAPDGMVEIKPDEWDAICARMQAKAERRWNRRQDWLVGTVSSVIGLALGYGVWMIVEALA